MKILVFSDTHGDTLAMSEIISRNRMGLDIVIHLGDHLKDLHSVMTDYPNIASVGVTGNCDFSGMYRNERAEGSISIEGKRIFYTHGHKYNVKHGREYLAMNAKHNGADIALYGHSHVALAEEICGVTVINPGSLTCPRDSSRGTYAMLEISDGKVKFEIRERDV